MYPSSSIFFQELIHFCGDFQELILMKCHEQLKPKFSNFGYRFFISQMTEIVSQIYLHVENMKNILMFICIDVCDEMFDFNDKILKKI
jgi:hypothetical protein